MTTLLPQTEKLAPDNPWNLKPPPLYHQLRTVEALRDHDLVVNTYNTGTGKTVASLLHLFDLDQSGKNVLFIAPTNALLAQHAEDIERFVAKNGLDFKVLRVNAAEVRALRLAQDPEATPVRPGELLQRLIRNYLEFEAEATRRQPIILVVNPDIFYYALYFRYSSHDRLNLFERFLTAFDYIVVDEFHYYDSKQLANFLFAFALFDQFGYFEVRGRKVCLLSATPTEEVKMYLDRLFGSRWALVSPQNEPAESAALGTIPVLAPLELELVAGDLQTWLTAHCAELVRWVVEKDLDGALISNGLWRINAAYGLLRPVLAEGRMGRITGPEPAEERARATGRDLILATPTVDIGYNFQKLNKARQNLDFVVCDARYGDELIQRIGRAGRVLGKPQTDRPSQAVALLSSEAVQALAAYDGQTLSRAEFASIVNECPHLPPKHSLTAYIRTHAITESFWPIYQVRKVLPPEEWDEAEALFERVREIFAPNTRRTWKGLKAFFHKLEGRERWLYETRRGEMPLNKYTAFQVADWLAWLDPEAGRYTPADLLPQLEYILGDGEQWRDLRAFVQSQVVITRALFAFRDSFQGPRAVFYDPQHLFSSQTVNVYDLFHLLSYYRLSPPLTRRQFQERYGETEHRGAFYFHLLEPRERPLTLGLVYHSEDDAAGFEQKWCGAPVALRGVRLQVRERGGDAIAGALDQRIVEALADRFLPMLIIPPDSVGVMIGKLRGTNLWARRLTVRFADGSVVEEYRALLGTAAFHAHAELLGYFLMKDRLKSEAIII
ncbi:MAG TPA: type I-D CRISPR-associated helicase Cas3' [Anaerolineae bacterium]|nr:type I-D CRISPR-associated helicase Cas3' [Anaerolineae bacterium]